MQSSNLKMGEENQFYKSNFTKFSKFYKKQINFIAITGHNTIVLPCDQHIQKSRVTFICLVSILR